MKEPKRSPVLDARWRLKGAVKEAEEAEAAVIAAKLALRKVEEKAEAAVIEAIKVLRQAEEAAEAAVIAAKLALRKVEEEAEAAVIEAIKVLRQAEEKLKEKGEAAVAANRYLLAQMILALPKASREIIIEQLREQLQIDEDNMKNRAPEEGVAGAPEEGVAGAPEEGVAGAPEEGVAGAPEEGVAGAPEEGVAGAPEEGVAGAPEEGVAGAVEPEEVISRGSYSYLRLTTKVMLAATPLYWAPKIFTSWAREGVISKVAGSVIAIVGTVSTTLFDSLAFSVISIKMFETHPADAIQSIYNSSTALCGKGISLFQTCIVDGAQQFVSRTMSDFSQEIAGFTSKISAVNVIDQLKMGNFTPGDMFTGIFAAGQLYNAYNTWNKYSELEAVTGERDSSKFAVVGLQLLIASTTLASATICGALVGAHIPIILGVGQVILNAHINQVINDRKALADVEVRGKALDNREGLVSARENQCDAQEERVGKVRAELEERKERIIQRIKEHKRDTKDMCRGMIAHLNKEGEVEGKGKERMLA